MAFWEIELKPGKPYRYRGRLRVCQAVLGNVVSAEGGNCKADAKTVVRCNVGKDRRPVPVCSLFAGRYETCHLGLKFMEQEEVVFSVLGHRSVHLCGYYAGPRECNEEPYGEDIAETESDESSHIDFSDEDQYESDFIDDSEDVGMHQHDHYVDYTCGIPSRPCKSTEVITEEIVEEERPGIGEKWCLAKKKNCDVSDSDDDSRHQFVVVPASVTLVDSEDEDGFPKSDSSEKTEEQIKEQNRKRKRNYDDSHSAPISTADGKASLFGVNSEDVAGEKKAPNHGKKQMEENTGESTILDDDAGLDETPVPKKMTDHSENGDSDGIAHEEGSKQKDGYKKSGEKDQSKNEETDENLNTCFAP